MMTLTTSSRKRNMSEESEYFPVTKRMNNLHIDALPVGSHGANPLRIQSIDRQLNGLEIESNEQLSDNCVNHLNPIDGNTREQCLHNCFNQMTDYCPELDLNSNPNYYESNRILFEAHQQRLHRMANSSRHQSYAKS